MPLDLHITGAFNYERIANSQQALSKYKAFEPIFLDLFTSSKQINLGTIHILIIYLPAKKNHRNQFPLGSEK